MIDTIKIKDKEYRVEANWNAVSEILENKGQDDLTNIGALGEVKFSELPLMIHATIKEGCRLEKKELDLTKEDIGEVLDIKLAEKFLAIYQKQVVPMLKPEDSKKK